MFFARVDVGRNNGGFDASTDARVVQEREGVVCVYVCLYKMNGTQKDGSGLSVETQQRVEEWLRLDRVRRRDIAACMKPSALHVHCSRQC